MPRATRPDTRTQLVAAATDYLREHGLAEVSLRELAAGIGTSHRMLLYHFGSKDGLLVEVARAVEAEQRTALSQLPEGQFDAPSVERLGRDLWARLRSPDLAPLERLFFELYVRGLQGGEDAARLLDGVVDTWIDALAPLFEASGLTPPEPYARLGVAVARGLLLDLLATGDDAGVTDAYEAYLYALKSLAETPTVSSRTSSRGS